MKRIFITIFCVLVAFYANAQILSIYGGENHKIFIGEMSTNKNSDNSIWNKYGTYGSKYNSNSIWNEYGNYGSKYSNDSPFNPYATNPPVIIDNNGKIWGYLTINQYISKKAEFRLAKIICDNHESIREDVTEWYDAIIESFDHKLDFFLKTKE